MKTLGIKEAAEFIKVHPITLYRMAARGEIPASKPGKRWVFLDIDLAEWLRAQYKTQASVGDSFERSNKCHFTNEKVPASGGLNSRTQQVDEYNKALGLL